MLNIILLDEIAEHNTLLRTLLEKNLQALGEEAEYHFAKNAREAATFAKQTKPHSIYFLDIELNDDENGIYASYRIHEADPDGYIVYVSAYQQYAMDCLHSHVFDFLAKPVSSAELSACLKAVLKEMKKAPIRQNKKLLFSADKRDYYIPVDNITLIKSNRTFCETTIGGQFYRWKEPLKNVSERIGDGDIIQISRNTIINLRHIASIDWDERKVLLETGETVAFSRSQIRKLREKQGGNADGF